jgi:hypothetical protein
MNGHSFIYRIFHKNKISIYCNMSIPQEQKQVCNPEECKMPILTRQIGGNNCGALDEPIIKPIVNPIAKPIEEAKDYKKLYEDLLIEIQKKKDYVNQKKKTKITCKSCHKEYTVGSYPTHLKSKGHRKNCPVIMVPNTRFMEDN